MNENIKKDYYVKVVAFQITVAVLLVAAVFIFFKNDNKFKEDYFSLISTNLESVELKKAVEAVSDYIINFSSGEKSESAAKAAGGKDITYKKSAKNTSFAPVFSTVKICPPVEKGRYTSFFGYRIHPITKKYGFHTGIDIAAAEGTKIRAAFSGVITSVGSDTQSGKYLVITHNDGFQTFYCHCSKILVKEGTVIKQGETVAFVGSTGYSTGPHLHFEIRKDRIRYNPLWLLEEQ